MNELNPVDMKENPTQPPAAPKPKKARNPNDGRLRYLRSLEPADWIARESDPLPFEKHERFLASLGIDHDEFLTGWQAYHDSKAEAEREQKLALLEKLKAELGIQDEAPTQEKTTRAKKAA